MDKQYYTCAEVAQIYGVKVDTIWAWVLRYIYHLINL